MSNTYEPIDQINTYKPQTEEEKTFFEKFILQRQDSLETKSLDEEYENLSYQEKRETDLCEINDCVFYDVIDDLEEMKNIASSAIDEIFCDCEEEIYSCIVDATKEQENNPLWKLEYEKRNAAVKYIEKLKVYLPKMIKEKLYLDL